MPQARTEPGCSTDSLAMGAAGVMAQVECCEAVEQHTRDAFLQQFLSFNLGPVAGHQAWTVWVSLVGNHAMMWHQRGTLMVVIAVM